MPPYIPIELFDTECWLTFMLAVVAGTLNPLFGWWRLDSGAAFFGGEACAPFEKLRELRYS